MQPRQPRQLYQPQYQPLAATSGPQYDSQWQYLEALVAREVPLVEMSAEEIASKDSFRLHLESVCQSFKAKYAESDLPSVTLQSFGSLSSGFASSGSDMDLAIVTDSLGSAEQPVSMHETNLPRFLEKELLDRNIGARLLTRTRVPIIKVCEKPTPELLQALRDERQKWEDSPNEDKNNSSQPSIVTPTPQVDINTSPGVDKISESDINPEVRPHLPDGHSSHPQSCDMSNTEEHVAPAQANSRIHASQQMSGNPPKSHNSRPWTRERVAGPLDFPKQGVGIQCDINFFNPLGLYNTKLLRCYSKCDPRVRPMILFVKAWAKRRRINSSYSGTLSSYGYVLMVLHYLVNVVHPPVLPNLQLQAAHTGLPGVKVDGWEVRFFGDEDEIGSSAAKDLLTQNRDPLGMLLRGFFQYFASTSGGQGFIWMQDVLSLRSPGGLLKKEEKGWTGAKTEVGDNHKEVRHRYLFAIEDPFELTHNVARTVTHNGIVAIRDEFRRSWRIIQAIGRGLTPRDGELFAELVEETLESATPSNTMGLQAPHVAPIPQVVLAADISKSAHVDEYAQAFPQLGLAPRSPQPPRSGHSTAHFAKQVPRQQNSRKTRFVPLSE
ncbi:hypothetical protein BDV97DRAFT_292764 [Delphinella strobiligena]|nr:hypothetical protein BDV97DRAFT_292764 [Delphinella strobiligena]